jgi:hypothetical protein
MHRIHTSISERRTTLAKAYGIKEVRCDLEIFGEKCPETCEFFAFKTSPPQPPVFSKTLSALL